MERKWQSVYVSAGHACWRIFFCEFLSASPRIPHPLHGDKNRAGPEFPADFPFCPNLSFFTSHPSSNDAKRTDNGKNRANNAKSGSAMLKMRRWSAFRSLLLHVSCCSTTSTMRHIDCKGKYYHQHNNHPSQLRFHIASADSWSLPRWPPSSVPRGRAGSRGCVSTASGCSATSSIWSNTFSTCTPSAGSLPARSARRRWRTSGTWGDTMSPTMELPWKSRRFAPCGALKKKPATKASSTKVPTRNDLYTAPYNPFRFSWKNLSFLRASHNWVILPNATECQRWC